MDEQMINHDKIRIQTCFRRADCYRYTSIDSWRLFIDSFFLAVSARQSTATGAGVNPFFAPNAPRPGSDLVKRPGGPHTLPRLKDAQIMILSMPTLDRFNLATRHRHRFGNTDGLTYNARWRRINILFTMMIETVNDINRLITGLIQG